MNMYLCLIKHHGGVEVWLHAFLSSALYGGKWSNLRPGSFNRGKMPRYQLDRRSSEPQKRSGRSDEEKKENLIVPARNWTPVVQTFA